ncbi:MAG: hypothetical protein M1822_007712 [Bathelium mastoideum]|nr:MAG: hypothetical protein M1822_007712 [Bathelium mastoideum]
MDFSEGLEHLSKTAPALFNEIERDRNFFEAVSRVALNPQHTDLLYTLFAPSFPDVCARWSLLQFHWTVIAAFGRVIPFAPHLAEHAENFFLRENARSQQGPYVSLTGEAEAQEYLLGLTRLLLFDNALFGRHIHAGNIQQFLAHPSSHVRYLAIRTLCLYVHAADAAMEAAITKHFGEEPIFGEFEGSQIDYRLFGLWEEQRHADILQRLEEYRVSTQSIKSGRFLQAAAFERLSPLTTEVLGLLLPKSGARAEDPGLLAHFVLTSTTAQNILRTAECLLQPSPILLSGLSGSGKTLLVTHLAHRLNRAHSMITLHLNEQSDARSLIGIYTSGSTPGSFTWKPGLLTTAVKEGRWILVEDIDRAPNEIISTLLPLVERRELLIPARGEALKAARGFRIIGTVRTTLNAQGEEPKAGLTTVGNRFWQHVHVALPSLPELRAIIISRYPSLHEHAPRILAVYGRLQQITGRPSFASENSTGTLKILSSRDLYKWCRRIAKIVDERGAFTNDQLDGIFLEAVDCFAGSFQSGSARNSMISSIAEELHIDPQRRDHLLEQSSPSRSNSKEFLRIGRAKIQRSASLRHSISPSVTPFANNRHTARLMERVAVAIEQKEPVLLVGETGTGKTTVIQHLALQTGRKLHAFNLSQQSETSDLLGGYKPVTIQSLVFPMKETFDDLFGSMFSLKKNQKYLDMLSKCIAKGQWNRVGILWNEALRMVEKHTKQSLASDPAEPPRKKQRVIPPPEAGHTDHEHSIEQWRRFAADLKTLQRQFASNSSTFAFSFVEGNIVRAIRNGDWVLLDEINLAASDTLDALADLLSGQEETPFITLSEAEGAERVEAHPDFRLFAAMNPATDVGKKDLPPGIRSRFTELFVESPDNDKASLQAIVEAYLESFVSSDLLLAARVTLLYQRIQSLSSENRLVDGANQKPHYSLRTLTRTLVFARDLAPLCSIYRALYEGFHMSFCTVLDKDSNHLISPYIEDILPKRTNTKAELKKPLRRPQDDRNYVQESGYWLRCGNFEIEAQQHYIITPFVRRNLDNLIRATFTRRFPILLQGPTSSGKTSMIEYLAKKSGNKFVRINNHEHTDLQEYLGTYVSDANGRLYFQEGILVQALREGHWIVLDELNLAPTDVLEALNRLLDDNRELFIPETQQVIHAHEDFMLFATQNPAGLYGGRKALSRAFRNRFLELHFDDIPVDELNEILQQRTQIPPSWSSHIVNVYKELSLLRQENRLFESKSFATLRDLFRWAFRGSTTAEELAAHGFMLLAERVRKPEEREAVKQVIERVISKRGRKITVDEDHLYSAKTSPEVQLYMERVTDISSSVVWTKAMRRLFILVAYAIRNNEPVLLIGETGCGKTTVCQMLADAFQKHLYSVNAHQNTETGDLIGAQRPIRNRAALESQLRSDLVTALNVMGHPSPASDSPLDHMLAAYNELSLKQGTENVPQVLRSRIATNRGKINALFEWVDGSLVEAMQSGQFFLLDEISLADDAVLERLNSVLEPQRTLLLAEKGPTDSLVTASKDFQFMATMNPGGDYGKRELSAALRNRFTEIWVPALSDSEDVLHIVEDKLMPFAKNNAYALVAFAEWFNSSYDSSATSSISLRDILAWVHFINSMGSSNPTFGVAHGAAMVYIDALGANPSGLLTASSHSLEAEKQACLDKLGRLLDSDLSNFYHADIEVTIDGSKLQIGPFSIPLAGQPQGEAGFTLLAPTTRSNAMRIVRGLQASKPLLIEGNPGVGKTTLVAALARAIGKPLTRINLSEQTDLMDLFGSDVPAEGAAIGTFAWRDAPFLRAMKNGDWVLLDEMNLASQSVLEGLNSCLDHRAEVYISELDQTFNRHPNFRLFAAQNPHHQGGGRKGLPASFVNRFTVVYADILRYEDLTIICKQAFPSVSDENLRKVSGFLQELDTQVVQHRRFGTQGGPWEFNLRDTQRWLQLVTSNEQLLGAGGPFAFLDTLFTLRFRNVPDRDTVQQIFSSYFSDTDFNHNYYHNLSQQSYQVGLGLISRQFLTDRSPAFLHSTLPKPYLAIMESLMICVQRNWPVILCGPTGSGKTNVLNRLAACAGVDVLIFSMNADIDSMDLVGTYEQVDPFRPLHQILLSVKTFAQNLFAWQLHKQGDESIARIAIHLLEALNETPAPALTRDRIMHLRKLLQDVKVTHFADTVMSLLAQLDQIAETPLTVDQARFEWVDGILVQALEQGRWLILDNANLCSSSVLDRLNSVLEPGGVFLINEHPGEKGEPKIVKPHPDFRIFFTVDPKYGELSRAMRNRSVELYLLPPQDNGQAPQKCLLPFESSLYRLRHCIQASNRVLGNNQMSQLVKSVALDHLSLSDDSTLQGFRESQSGPNRSLIESLPAKPLVPHISYFDSLSSFYDQAARAINQPSFSSIAQALVPLNNEALVQQSSSTYHGAILISSIYELLRNLSEMDTALKSILSTNAPLPKTSRLFRSYGSSHIPGALQDSTAGIHAILSTIIRTADECLTRCLGESTVTQRELLWLKLVFRFWWSIFGMTCSETFDDARFQAVLKVSEASIVPTNIVGVFEDIYGLVRQSINTLEASAELTTGRAMDPLWEMFRSTQIPANYTALQTLLQLEDLADKFDQISMIKIGTSLPDIIRIRDSFAKAFEIILDSQPGSFDNISSTLTELFDGNLDSATASSKSVFADEFEIFCQMYNLNGSAPPNKLAFFAQRVTKLTGRTRDMNDLAALNGYLGYERRGQSSSSALKGGFPASLIKKLSMQVTEVPLKEVELLRREIDLLGQIISQSIDTLCGNQLQPLQTLLASLMQKVMVALGAPHDLDVHEFARTLFERNGDFFGNNAPWRKIFNDQFRDVFDYFGSGSHSRSVAAASNAWIQFGIGCLLLYVPDKPHDPALRPVIARELWQQRTEELKRLISALGFFELGFSGLSTSLRIRHVENELDLQGSEPTISAIARPPESELAALQIEFANVLALVNSLLSRGIGAALDVSSQQNLLRLIQRLSDGYRAYDDLTAPVVGFLQCLQIGVLLDERASGSSAIGQTHVHHILSVTPFLAATPDRIESIFDAMNSEKSAVRMHCLEALALHRSIQGHIPTKYHLAVCNCLNRFFVEWKDRLESDQEKAAAKSSLYRYRGVDDEDEIFEEKEFDEIFPNYEVNDEQGQKELGSYNPPPTATNLANVHEVLFLGSSNQCESLESLVMKALERIPWLISETIPMDMADATPLVFLGLTRQEELLENFSASSEYNFYTSPNLAEAKRLTALVERVQVHFTKIHDAWPEQATPVEILQLCKETLLFRHVEPVAKFLTKVEKLHSSTSEWQAIASKEWNVDAVYTELTSLIISWRQLELSTWATMLDVENSKATNDAKAWWFVAYESLIAAPTSFLKSENEQLAMQGHGLQLLKTLEEFLVNTTLGQYETRVRLLQQFRAHLAFLLTTELEMKPICDALTNIVNYYSHFVKPVRHAIEEKRKPLEQKIREVIKLTSWKDRNVSALRESSKASHRKLFRTIKKYRAVLNESAENIIQIGLPDTSLRKADSSTIASDDVEKEPSVAEDPAHFTMQSALAGADLPARFKNIGSTVSMMREKSIVQISFDSTSHLQTFTSDTEASMTELRKATPAVLTEDNKQILKHLKARKRKLFADVLRAVRQMGFKSSLSTDTLIEQESRYKVLANVPPLPSDSDAEMSASQFHFSKFLEFMPRVRQAARDHSDEITSAEVARSTAYLESMLSGTMRQRRAIAEFAQDCVGLTRVCDQATLLCKDGSCHVEYGQATDGDGYGIACAAKWLPTIINLGIAVVKAQDKFGALGFSGVCYDLANWKLTFLQISANMNQAPPVPNQLRCVSTMNIENAAQAKLEEFRDFLKRLSEDHPQLSYLSNKIRPWTSLSGHLLGSDSVQDVDTAMSPNIDYITELIDRVLAAVQDLEKALRLMPSSAEDSMWLIKAEDTLEICMSHVNAAILVPEWQELLDNLHLLEQEDLESCAKLIGLLLPILHQYRHIHREVFDRFSALHCATCRMSHILAQSFVQVAEQGFCGPNESSRGQAGSGEKIEEGTGLGDGDAMEDAEDISKEMGGDEDLEELAQQPGSKNDGDELEDEKDAVDQADEMEGHTEQVENGDSGSEEGEAEEGSQDDAASELGSVDDLGPSAVDEKMWDEAAEKDAKDRKADDLEKGSKEKDEEMAGTDQQHEGSSHDENMDDVTGKDAEAPDTRQPEEAELEHPDQSEKLDLPQDLRIGENGDEENLSSDSDAGTDFGDREDEVDRLAKEETDLAHDPEQDEQAEDDNKSTSEVAEGDSPSRETGSPPRESTGDQHFSRDRENGAALDENIQTGSGGSEDILNENQAPEEAASEREGNEEADLSTNQQNARASNGRTGQKTDQEPNFPPSDPQEDAHDKQPYKKIGDALEQWYRQQRAIRESGEEPKEVPQSLDQDTKMADIEFQHLRDDDEIPDTQALGTATDDEATAVDTSKAIDGLGDDTLQDRFSDVQDEPASDDGADMEEKRAEELQLNEQSPFSQLDAFIDGKGKEVDTETSEDSQMPDIQEVDEEITPSAPASGPVELHPDPLSIEQARALWLHYENATRTLSLALTEHLRLILTPTRATKMRGDFRTGKRLNMKRIIPYIASQYKRDKIWMRRSVPSKRAYQIMLAIDDSSSMAESGGGQLALAAVVLISRALSMLEAGELGVAAFGENVNVAHAFDQPFAGDAGAEVFRHFGFKQRKTDVRLLLQESIALFQEARLRTSGSSSELWQLQLIISDGVCDDHPGIKRLVRQAQEERIMIVFIIVDATTDGKKQSIMELQEADFGPDENGEMKVKMRRYLDTFPFQYYLIVRNVEELPGVLAGALRQWLAEVVDTGT